mmetsp:Transcript_40053/g.120699  ORF Transcript_40053/g.120699 Transcript_40053/m.120699 type:complete len:81 (+) Transcript_40053:3344-3586(+)
MPPFKHSSRDRKKEVEILNTDAQPLPHWAIAWMIIHTTRQHNFCRMYVRKRTPNSKHTLHINNYKIAIKKKWTTEVINPP